MKKINLLVISMLLLSVNSFASIDLDESCDQGLRTHINSVKAQAVGIINSSASSGRVEYAAYLLYISTKYVDGFEQMQDSEMSDVASICEVKFDVKKLVEASRW